jgi:hypothetical protein
LRCLRTCHQVAPRYAWQFWCQFQPSRPQTCRRHAPYRNHRRPHHSAGALYGQCRQGRTADERRGRARGAGRDPLAGAACRAGARASEAKDTGADSLGASAGSRHYRPASPNPLKRFARGLRRSFTAKAERDDAAELPHGHHLRTGINPPWSFRPQTNIAGTAQARSGNLSSPPAGRGCGGGHRRAPHAGWRPGRGQRRPFRRKMSNRYSSRRHGAPPTTV